MAAVTAGVIGAAAAVKGTMDAKKQAKSAQKAQTAENEANRAFIEQQAKQAREDVMRLFPQAQQSRDVGAQGALQAITGAIST